MLFVLRNNLQIFQRCRLKLSEQKKKNVSRKPKLSLIVTENPITWLVNSFTCHPSVDMCCVNKTAVAYDFVDDDYDGDDDDAEFDNDGYGQGVGSSCVGHGHGGRGDGMLLLLNWRQKRRT